MEALGTVESEHRALDRAVAHATALVCWEIPTTSIGHLRNLAFQRLLPSRARQEPSVDLRFSKHTKVQRVGKRNEPRRSSRIVRAPSMRRRWRDVYRR